MGMWPILDAIAMNFHLVVAIYTVILCSTWQVSLFTSFYLLCIVTLIVKTAK